MPPAPLGPAADSARPRCRQLALPPTSNTIASSAGPHAGFACRQRAASSAPAEHLTEHAVTTNAYPQPSTYLPMFNKEPWHSAPAGAAPAPAGVAARAPCSDTALAGSAAAAPVAWAGCTLPSTGASLISPSLAVPWPAAACCAASDTCTGLAGACGSVARAHRGFTKAFVYPALELPRAWVMVNACRDRHVEQ